MNFKIISIILYIIVYLFNLVLKISEYQSRNNPIPQNVSDIYDKEQYLSYRSYSSEQIYLSIFNSTVSTIVSAIVLFTTFLPAISNNIKNIYLQTIVVVAASIIIDSIVSVIFEYINTFRIEEKYGFNKSTIKTFVSDQIKSLIISTIVFVAISCLFVFLYQILQDKIVIVFGSILFLIILFISFIYPILSKIYYKFKPLEDGSLKDKLTSLLESHNFKVKEIKVMLASERTTKSNAYFSGFGKMKTIVLFDTLIDTMDEDEIVAVFAHELGHGLHKDTLKNNIINLFMMFAFSILIYANVKHPQISQSFGFTNINYGLAILLLMYVELPFVSPIINIISSFTSRKAEYRADRQPVKEGYGKPLISALKKLAKANFTNLAPNKLNILLQYSHPTISQRVEAIEKEMNK